MEITEAICDARPADSDINQFEKVIGGSLSEDYRAFLISYNGGRPRPSGFSFTNRQGAQEDSSLHYFFGLHSGRIGSLERQVVRLGDRIPAEFLPIATDAFGNLILIGTRDSNRGRIYFWDHELEEDPPTRKCITPIATSFADFVNALTNFEHGG